MADLDDFMALLVCRRSLRWPLRYGRCGLVRHGVP